jgi:hypothetical protein
LRLGEIPSVSGDKRLSVQVSYLDKLGIFGVVGYTYSG